MKFDDWENALKKCIQCNGWSDDKRIVELLPSCLSGLAERTYRDLQDCEKETLNTALTSMRSILDPNGAARNRHLFIHSRRYPGEPMSIFVYRLKQYVEKMNDSKHSGDHSWCKSLMVQKIYENLNTFDAKLLRGINGKSEDIEVLCKKADDLIVVSEEAIRSCYYRYQYGDDEDGVDEDEDLEIQIDRKWPIHEWTGHSVIVDDKKELKESTYPDPGEGNGNTKQENAENENITILEYKDDDEWEDCDDDDETTDNHKFTQIFSEPKQVERNQPVSLVSGPTLTMCHT